MGMAGIGGLQFVARSVVKDQRAGCFADGLVTAPVSVFWWWSSHELLRWSPDPGGSRRPTPCVEPPRRCRVDVEPAQLAGDVGARNSDTLPGRVEQPRTARR